MSIPGTPAITLPPFKAPAFSAARIDYGAAVCSVTMEGAGTNVPFTFGQPLKEGDLTFSDGLLARGPTGDLPLQVDAKATHPDGSMRHAIVSGIIPALTGSQRFDLVRVQRPTTPSTALWTPEILVLATFDTDRPFAATLGAHWDILLDGPVAAESTCLVPFMRDGIAHPDMSAQFIVRAYANGNTWVSVALEHSRPYTGTGDLAYGLNIAINGASVYSSSEKHYPAARFRAVFWTGAAPNLHIKHDIDYLIASKADVNRDRRVQVPEATLESYRKALAEKDFGPMGVGRFAAGMGATGGRPEIGIAPDCYAATVLTMDKRAKELMLASAECAGSWSVHRRDDSDGPARGRPLDVIHFQSASLQGNPNDTINPLTKLREKLYSYTPNPASITAAYPYNVLSASLNKEDSSHQAAFAYLPYLLTGDFYYLEELHFWCHYNLYCSNPHYRGLHRGLLKSDQLRGQGWSMRTLFQAAAITPDDHPSKAAFRYWVAENLAFYNRTYTDGAPSYADGSINPFYNELGIITNGYSISYKVQSAAANGIAPWMDDHFVSAIGHGAELGFTEAGRLLKWLARFQIGRMTAPGYCFIDAAVYSLRVREGDATTPWYESLAECHLKTFDPKLAGLPCNSQTRQDGINALAGTTTKFIADQMTGYPTDPQGFVANFQPALAMAVDSGHEAGAEAWAKFDARASQPNYGTAPQFAIVPRTLGAVEPPPPPPPPAPITPPAATSAVVLSGTVKVSSPALASKRLLRVVVYDPATGRTVVTSSNRTASAAGVVQVESRLLLGGKQYAARVFDAAGVLLAGVKP